MKQKFFYDNYKLEDFIIEDISFTNNSIIIKLNMLAHLDLIANGYRPELDVLHKLCFKFNNPNTILDSNEYILSNIELDDLLILTINIEPLTTKVIRFCA